MMALFMSRNMWHSKTNARKVLWLTGVFLGVMKNVSPNPLKLLSLHLSEMETLRLESNYNCKSENCIVACYKYY